MNFPWFRRIGPLFVPVRWPGWMIVALTAGYVVRVFVDIDSRSHSVSDTLMNFVFNLFLIAIAYSLVAFALSFGSSED